MAIVLGEADAESLLEVLLSEPGAEGRSISAASLVEASIVLESRQGPDATRDLLLLRETATHVVPVDEDQASRAVAAWRRFGKGRHPAGLNVGDCFSYALADRRGESLLFKGDDFGQTDIRSAG